MKYVALGVGVAVLLVDQLIKLIIPVSVTNNGYALGILSNAGGIIVWVNLIVWIGILLFSRYKVKDSYLKLLLRILVIIGSSNLIDRLRLGYVVDYLHLGPIAFNLADIGLCIGIILLLAKLFRNDRNRNF